MFKRYFLFAFTALCVSFILSNDLKVYAQDEEESEESVDEQESKPPSWSVFGDVGYHWDKYYSLAAGLRYWNVGLSVGLGGLYANIPNYSFDTYSPTNPDYNDLKHNLYSEAKYPALIVSFDAYYFYDFKKFTVFGNVGYFMQSDTILSHLYSHDTYYFLRKESLSGVSYGGGFNYLFSELWTIGLGYHNKRGAYIQLGYKL